MKKIFPIIFCILCCFILLFASCDKGSSDTETEDNVIDKLATLFKKEFGDDSVAFSYEKQAVKVTVENSERYFDLSIFRLPEGYSFYTDAKCTEKADEEIKLDEGKNILYVGSSEKNSTIISVIVFRNEVDPDHEHSFGKWKIVTQATCGTDGLERRVCECGEVEKRVIPATGEHSFNDQGVCTVCGTSEGFSYSLKSDDTYEITGYVGTPIDLMIPDEYENKDVTSIGTRAFNNCTGIESVKIPVSITKIGSRAFANCGTISSFIFQGTRQQWNAIEKASNWKTSSEFTVLFEETDAMKFGLIALHDETSTFDKQFIDSARTACEELGVPLIIKSNVKESSRCYSAAVDLIEQGCTMIFADSYGHEQFLLAAAKEYPDVQFIHFAGILAHTERLPNFHNAYCMVDEGAYLAGIAAGMKLNRMITDGIISANQAKLGFVSCYTYAECISRYTAYYLGAKSVCPTVMMEVFFTGAWFSVDAERAAAVALAERGCVILSQHSESAGVLEACRDRGLLDIGYTISWKDSYSSNALLSYKMDYVPCMKHYIESVLNDEDISEEYDWVGTLQNGSVEVFGYNENLIETGTQEAISQAAERLKNGTLKLFDTNTFTVDSGDTLDSYRADINYDPTYTPDTECVINGVFEECYFRSAPYFDVMIDGISVLNISY